MSTRHPSELKFEFGSTVTVLTTAATCHDSDKHIKNQGIFTGVVLDETKLNLKRDRDPKHISISLDNLPGDEDGDDSGDYYKLDDAKYEWEKEDKKKEHCDCEWEKDDKKKEHCDCEWEKDDKKKEHCDWDKDDKKKDDKKDDKKKEEKEEKKDEKKDDKKPEHDKEIEVKKAETFLVLSLTCPSFPFMPGQIVWINIDQIVAFSIACRS